MEIEATYVKSRHGRAVTYDTVVTATGIAESGDSEALGVTLGDSEDAGFWIAFLLSLRFRGLHGVVRVISEEHGGLQEALEIVVPGVEVVFDAQRPVIAVTERSPTSASTYGSVPIPSRFVPVVAGPPGVRVAGGQTRGGGPMRRSPT